MKLTLTSTTFATLLTVLVVGWLPTPAQAFSDADADRVLSKVVDLAIRPAYQELHSATDQMAKDAAALCVNPSEKGLAALETRFSQTVRAWSRVELVRIGPVLEESRLERMLFFPDRKSIGFKQVRAILDARDPAVGDADALAKRSVAVQGLGAFELVFFGSYPESVIGGKNLPSCLYGAAIAENVDRIAEQLSVAWTAPDGITKALTHPGPDSTLYRDRKEAVTAVLGLAIHGIEVIREQRIENFYRSSKDKAHPKLAIYWRSANTIASLVNNLEGLRDLWVNADMASLLDTDSRSVSSSIVFDFNAAIKALSSMPEPTEATLADPKYRAKLDYVLMTTRDMLLRLNDDYGKAIGLGAGFSFSDGD